jgi:2-dehydro-3-deoxyphosphogalactonate aldolase
MSVDVVNTIKERPIFSILRGITPDEIADVSEALYDGGIRIIEVPLNSPDPYRSIETLAKTFSDRCLCGAGTVVSVDQVDKVNAAGGQLIVSPNTNLEVITRSIELGMTPVPGFNTPSEAYAAIGAGARVLKMFPAANIGLDYFRSISEILPADVQVIATGGINVENASHWLQAGIAGIGVGSNLYMPGCSAAHVNSYAKKLSEVVRNHMKDKTK